MRVSDGGLFREGFHKELDELLEINRDHKAWIARYQADLSEQTGIKTLRVGFTRMFGYYIEVSKGQADRVPDTFHTAPDAGQRRALCHSRVQRV